MTKKQKFYTALALTIVSVALLAAGLGLFGLLMPSVIASMSLMAQGTSYFVPLFFEVITMHSIWANPLFWGGVGAIAGAYCTHTPFYEDFNQYSINNKIVRNETEVTEKELTDKGSKVTKNRKKEIEIENNSYRKEIKVPFAIKETLITLSKFLCIAGLILPFSFTPWLLFAGMATFAFRSVLNKSENVFNLYRDYKLEELNNKNSSNISVDTIKAHDVSPTLSQQAAKADDIEQSSDEEVVLQRPLVRSKIANIFLDEDAQGVL